MKPVRKQRGFTLIAAIFLLVVVAALVVYVGNIRVAQQTTSLYGVQGARAMQAARSGLEWGIYQALNSGCPAGPPFTIPDPELSSFSVNVTCTGSAHVEGNAPVITTFQITATATSGNFGSLDYVQRLMQATVSRDPP